MPSVKRHREATDESYSEQETARRFNAGLKRALNTPHKPHKPVKKKAPTKRVRPAK